MRISDWSSDVCSSDLVQLGGLRYTAAADSTITVGVGNTLGVDGTIIVAPSVLANDQTITGGFLTGGAGGGTLGVQQNGAGTFTIDSTIVDNGGGTSFVNGGARSEEHTSELPSPMRISSAVFALKKKNNS